MQKSELRLPKQQLELALVNIGPFWHPDGNSFELTQRPLDFPWNLEQMQLVFPITSHRDRTLEVHRRSTVAERINPDTLAKLKALR